jgi:transcriptional regulator
LSAEAQRLAGTIVYTPRHFAFDDPAELARFIDANNFGTLVSTTGGTLSVSRLPFLIDVENHTLHGHVARANPHWQTLEAADDLLVTFDGPHAYVSPTWYATPDLVPTWNYVTATVRGRVTLTDSPEEVFRLVTDLSRKHESGRRPAWDPDALPQDKRNALVAAIVGFSIAIDELSGKQKLSQNRSRDDVEGVINGLRAESGASTADELADLMKRTPDPESPRP